MLPITVYQISELKLQKYLVIMLLFIIPNLVLFSKLAKAAEGDYLVGAGDVVKISVFDYPELSLETRISESGSIALPLIGEVIVGGKTTTEAEVIIAGELFRQGFVREPRVTMIVSEFVSQQVSILGFVLKPGNYTLHKPSTLLELLAMAGGVLPDAGDKANLTRGSIENAQVERIEIDLFNLFRGDLANDIKVKAGDLIYVPKSQVFYIYGEVQHPGMFRLQRNLNVAQAISIGGGLTPIGTDNDIRVKRKLNQGDFASITIQLEDLVQPDDVIYVDESWF